MANKPRVKVPKKAKSGDIIQIKTLMSHKMETGNRKDKKTGKLIPRKIINKFVCSFKGKEVMSAVLHPAVAANPYLAFYAKATESGTFDFEWTEDGGKTITASGDITVS
ncbi:MAG: thiosulfate oxidation carrier complex protein SoxZ [Rhodospirillaceae bacterium]|nr:thiosulfate oxidation carrier complex protein SoxZ [Rhodospirillaceae bacterium]MBL6930211.1 thiosulfate oxidation carrier complex protein SoxZ [Rhodospirillales bacterium]MBL6940784.1 thiosulfate oxidation carrier complex protein SoxZ [Rhodospirillales bacterium]